MSLLFPCFPRYIKTGRILQGENLYKTDCAGTVEERTKDLAANWESLADDLLIDQKSEESGNTGREETDRVDIDENDGGQRKRSLWKEQLREKNEKRKKWRKEKKRVLDSELRETQAANYFSI